MNCKFCNAELEDGNMICPACGEDNSVRLEAETEMEEAVTAEAVEMDSSAEEVFDDAQASAEDSPAIEKSRISLKAIIAICCCGVLLLGLAATVFLSMNGGFILPENNVLVKESYSVTDEQAAAAADKVIATVGDKKLTNGQFQIFYWGQVFDYFSSYSDYLSYMGVDYTLPLDEQYYSEADGTTWQHYFIDNALSAWNRYQLLSMMAEDAGFVLSEDMQEYLDTLEQSLQEMAEAYEIETAEELLQGDFGAGCTIEDYRHYLTLYYYGYEYFLQEFEALDPTDDEIKAYFDENYEQFEAQGITEESGSLVDVRHILIQPEGCEFDDYGYVVADDDQWEACRVAAQALLDDWAAGEATQDSFAALANAHSVDGGSNTNGGLYTEVMEGDMVEAFDAWCFDESRVAGDTGLVKTEFGYHIMYFVGSEEMWHAYAKSTLVSDLMNQRITEFSDANPMEVNYKNIELGVVDLAS